ncbi:MAG TPA: OsmC family protein [Terracidiphilus sp.]|jgi:putative redox protein
MVNTELTLHAVHKGGMRVRVSDGNFDVLMDYPLHADQPTVGPTPLPMLLASLAACSANSVIVVLQKMQQPVSQLEVEAHATRSPLHPTVLLDISLEFIIRGESVDPAAVARALQLSEERLCPVWNMLKASTPIKATFQLRHCLRATAEPL